MDEKKTNPQNSGRLQNSKQEWSCPLTKYLGCSQTVSQMRETAGAPLEGLGCIALCGSISKSGFCLCPSPGSPGAPALGQRAPQVCPTGVQGSCAVGVCLPGEKQWVRASQVRSHLYEFIGFPPKPSCVTTPSVTSYEVPDPRERQAEPGGVSASGKDAPWACGLTDPVLPAHLAPVLVTPRVFWTERNIKVRYEFPGNTVFGATWPDCHVCPCPGLTLPSPSCPRRPGRPTLGGDLGQPVWGPGSGLGSGRPAAWHAAGFGAGACRRGRGCSTRAGTRTAARPSLRPRSPDPGWRGHVLLLGMLTAPTGSLQPWGQEAHVLPQVKPN